MRTLRFDTIAARITFIFLCYVVAAASFGGFFEKWAFRDGMAYSAIEMMDGESKRPFVYRQLFPATANLINSLVPQEINDKFTSWLTADPPKRNFIYRYFSNAKDSTNPEYMLRYYVLFGMCFASYFLGILALRAACMEFYPDRVAATLAAFSIALIFPMLTTEGGYMYDMAELMFMALAVLLAAKGNIVLLALMVGLATFNKESFLLFVFALYPFIRARFSMKHTIAIGGLLLGIAAAINLAVKLYYAGNPGGFVVNQLPEHIYWLLDPRSYFLFEVNYGAVTTKGFHVIHLIIVAFIIRAAWRYLTPTLRQHVLIAAAINIPFFIVFCYQGELRNLSMLFVGFTLMVSIAISRYLQRLYGATGMAPADNLTATNSVHEK
ncbi:MAG TPA: hypothetical protein VD810_03875 [Methylophilaceae bacterium]|nr:hypothetical protein [Methylophilaceae bacterium]